ncbi:65_t:CDS:2, partial [Gigaspora rosea]
MLNKIETVTEKDQVVKLAVKLIWSATNRNVSSITFKGESSEFFCQDRSIIVDLGETDVVIIKGETYRKLTEKGTVSSEGASSIDSEKKLRMCLEFKKASPSKNSMELDFSENETTNLVEDNNEEVGEIIPNVQDLQPFVIINDPIPVTSIINRVPAIYVNKGKHKVEQT